jgi:hypothetical protein
VASYVEPAGGRTMFIELRGAMEGRAVAPAVVGDVAVGDE